MDNPEVEEYYKGNLFTKPCGDDGQKGKDMHGRNGR